eukprot:1188029-Prorocentrum_minimum.AAC.5
MDRAVQTFALDAMEMHNRLQAMEATMKAMDARLSALSTQGDTLPRMEKIKHAGGARSNSTSDGNAGGAVQTASTTSDFGVGDVRDAIDKGWRKHAGAVWRGTKRWSGVAYQSCKRWIGLDGA